MIHVAATFRIAEPQGRKEFQQSMELRWKVLRAPWGQPRGTEQDDLEPQAYHRVAKLDDGTVIGTARAHFLDKTHLKAQIRYMAVDPRFQGLGIGADLLQSLEQNLRMIGCKEVVLQARNEVLPFYMKQGYRLEKPGHTLYGNILHSYMVKVL